MKKTIVKENLEKLLLANWTFFLDKNKLLAFVLSVIRDQKFNVVPSTFAQKGTSIKLSKFELKDNGFVLWAEFAVPKENGTIVGTSELELRNDGSLSHIQSIGTLFQAD